MASNTIVVQGIVKADGTIELQGPVALPPGPVEVTVRAIPSGQGEDLVTLLTRIRAEQQARGHTPRNREEIDSEIRQMHDEWEVHQLGIERLKEECRRNREAAREKSG